MRDSRQTGALSMTLNSRLIRVVRSGRDLVFRRPGAAFTGVGSLLFARVFLGVSTLALFAVLARILSQEAFGLFGFAWSVSYLFAAITEGGYGMLVGREVARTPSEAGFYLGAFVPLRLALAIGIPILVIPAAIQAGSDSSLVVLLIAACAANFQVVSGAPRDFFIATNHSELAAAHAVVETLLRTIIVIATAAVTRSVPAIFVSAALFHLVWVGVTMPLVWLLLRPDRLVVGARSWSTVLARSAPFGVFVILGAAYAQIDIVLASLLLPLSAVAILQVAVRILVATDYVPEAAWRWAYPRMSRSAVGDLERFAQQVARFSTAIVSFGIGAAAALIITAPIAIPALFGAQYADAVMPTQLVAAAIPLRYGAHVYGTSLSAAGLHQQRVKLALAVIAGTAIGESILVIAFGVLGAAAGILASSASLLFAYLWAARRSWGTRIDLRPAIVALSFALVAATAVSIGDLMWT